MSSPTFGTVVIYGVGLIGGSIGMALLDRGLATRVVGLGRDERRLQKARDLRAVTEFSIAPEVVTDADLLVLCAPPLSLADQARRVRSYLGSGCLVTEVASTKVEPLRSLRTELGVECRLVGGHPMAGSEESGVEHARVDLFVDRTWFITPDDHSDAGDVETLEHWVQGLGAQPFRIPPLAHDRLVSRTSHLPHLVSAALMSTVVADRDPAEIARGSAGGLRDVTRVAGGDPHMWADIALTNRQALREDLAQFRKLLDEFDQCLESGNEEKLTGLFRQAGLDRRRVFRR